MRLYRRYIILHIKSMLQYRASLFLATFGQLLATTTAFLSLAFLFARFHTVGGYTFAQCLLCFSVVLLSFSLAECFFRGFDRFSQLVRQGTFDRILLRPKSLLLQVLGEKIEFSRIGRLLYALAVFVYALPRSGVSLTPFAVLTLFLMLLGGFAVFTGLFLLFAALCFFTLEGLEFMNIFTNGAVEYGRYPIDIYGKRMLRFCTYVIPFACFQYYPFLSLLGRAARAFALLPLAALCFPIPCYLLWRLGIRKYQSAGS